MKKLSFYIFLLLSLNLHAQNKRKLNFNTPNTTGGEFVAFEEINLQSGFSFVSTAGKSLHLKVELPFSFDEAKNKNYILTRTYVGDGGDLLDQIQYFDGLGRPNETVHRGTTPNKHDLVFLQSYDGFGRESETWLPAVANSNKGKFVAESIIKTNAKNSNEGDQNPFSKPVYEASPLNRVLEQYGPGADWHSKGKALKVSYKTNNGTSGVYACQLFKVEGIGMTTSLSKGGYYPNGELYATEMSDEDGNKSYEFKDKLGQVVLTRQMEKAVQHDTYYVYDDFGNLSYVIPPRGVDEITNFADNDVKMKQFSYLYKYDSRNRCVQKRLPSTAVGTEATSGWIYYVYDKADQLIFTQDGVQRMNKEWAFSVPDAFGRVVLTGICKNTLTVGNQIEAVVKATWAKTTNVYKGYTISGITLATNFTVTSANYYDSYEFMGLNGIPLITDANFKPEKIAGYGAQYTEGYKGLLTGSLTAQMNTTSIGDYLHSVMYYDNRGRLIQTKSNNHLTGGIEKEYIAYNFIGQPTKKMHVHAATGKNELKEIYAYSYDHAGRLIDTKHKLNAGTETLLASNKYDELGRLETNKKGGNANLNTTYTYNIRSWTKSISSNLFKQTLYYNESYGGSTPRYNGNVSAMNWTVSEDKTRGYTFSYDDLSRITAARYLENGAANNSYNVPLYSYDKHGNIKSIERHGKNSIGTTFGVIDKLTLSYAGNQLTRVDDAAPNIIFEGSSDFKNNANTDNEYTYNANGAMNKDLNKGISNIQYNSLNLPMAITIAKIGSDQHQGSITYTYSASGTKLCTVHSPNPVLFGSPIMGISNSVDRALTHTKTTDYVSNKIYENGGLKRILIDGGYIEDGVYYFYLTDHLGNNRVVADANGKAIQKTHYYPFGMAFAEGLGSEKQPYKYNGKELDKELGLEMYDYSARYMDPAIGRFSSVDPLAEKYYSISPYAYVMNNPLKYIDPDGRFLTDYRNDKGEMLFKTDDNLKDIIIVKRVNEDKFETKLNELNEKGKIDDAESNQKELHTLGETPKEYEDHLDFGDANLTLGVKVGYEKGHKGEERTFGDGLIGFFKSAVGPEMAAYEAAIRKGQNHGLLDKNLGRISRINANQGFKNNIPLIRLPELKKPKQ